MPIGAAVPSDPEAIWFLPQQPIVSDLAKQSSRSDSHLGFLLHIVCPDLVFGFEVKTEKADSLLAVEVYRDLE